MFCYFSGVFLFLYFQLVSKLGNLKSIQLFQFVVIYLKLCIYLFLYFICCRYPCTAQSIRGASKFKFSFFLVMIIVLFFFCFTTLYRQFNFLFSTWKKVLMMRLKINFFFAAHVIVISPIYICAKHTCAHIHICTHSKSSIKRNFQRIDVDADAGWICETSLIRSRKSHASKFLFCFDLVSNTFKITFHSIYKTYIK